MRKFVRGSLARMCVNAISLFMIVLFIASCGAKNESDQEVDTMNTQREIITSDMKRIGGEDVAAMILDGEYERLYIQFSDELKNIVKLEEFRSMGEEFVKGIDSFKIISQLQVNGYESLVWNDPTGSKGLTATMDKKGTITGIQILHYSPHPQSDNAYSKTIFELPFQGDWLVYWGGDNILVNYHYEYEQIRYAFDFVKEKNGYTYEGNPKINESYFAFNEDVLASADGVVVASVDGILDNDPVGKMNEEQPAGNMVTIKHSNGEYSTIAHLRNGSVKVKTGDTVTAGQLIGKCGNSGNSSEPHIHFQGSTQMDGNNIMTIPTSFKGGILPIRGDIVTGTINEQ
jgi:hypothetical protein